MDINPSKTPATLPFAAWQAMAPDVVARTVHERVAALREDLRRAALAWLRPEREIARAIKVSRGMLRASVAAADATTSQPETGLAGIPYLLKDLFDFPGVPTRAGSTFLDQVRATPERENALGQRLGARGGVCAGKTHLVEFAAGLFGDNAHYGDCPHPNFPDRLSGGSSSGSAALVAAGVVPFAIGTDTGGSVRVPASFCGLFGFRLEPGEAFIRDAFALSPTMDTAGWFTNNATDMLTAWRALCPSQSSAMTTKEPRGVFLAARDLGISFDSAVGSACDKLAATFSSPVDQTTKAALLASWNGSIEAYTVIALSEAHAIHREWLTPFRDQYEPSIWQRFSAGGNYPAAQLSEAHRALAQVRAGWQKIFEVHDFLVMPATPFPALKKADCTPDARTRLLTLTTPASLGGLAALTIPVPLATGLTTGLQIILPRANSAAVAWILKGALVAETQKLRSVGGQNIFRPTGSF